MYKIDSELSLPRILIFLCGDSVDHLAEPVSPATLTLVFSLHQTDGQRVPGGGVRVLSEENIIPVLRPVLPALLPRPGLVPAGHEEDTVALNIAPTSRTLPATAETAEVPRVGVGHGQP